MLQIHGVLLAYSKIEIDKMADKRENIKEVGSRHKQFQFMMVRF